MTQKPDFETLYVERTEVACDGDAGPLGHPRVFLHIDRAVGEVTCPYCSRRYIYDDRSHHAA